MIEQEAGIAHGGILADDVGLGKMTQSIALIKATGYGPTLVVTTAARLDEWAKALRTSGFEDEDVFVYRGKNSHVKDLGSKTVVITSYASLVYECNKDADPKKNKRNHVYAIPAAAESDKSAHQVESGLFIEALWHRVILDKSRMLFAFSNLYRYHQSPAL
jgi:DNA repair protein RAD16